MKSNRHCPSCGLLDPKVLCINTSIQTPLASPSKLRTICIPGPPTPIVTESSEDGFSSESQSSSTSTSPPSSPASSYSESSADGDWDKSSNHEPSHAMQTEAKQQRNSYFHDLDLSLDLSSLHQSVNAEKTESILRTCAMMLFISVLFAWSRNDEYRR